MNRLDREPSRQLEETVASLRSTVDDLRQAQTFGASNVRRYELHAPGFLNDMTISNLTTTTPQCVELTVTPNTLASNPVIVFNFNFAITASSGSSNVLYRIDSLPPVGGVQKFRLYLMAQTATLTSISLAFYFVTISDGTYTFALVTP